MVLSADVRHEPICAYVEQGTFGQDTVPATLVEWFDVTVENIEMVRDEIYDNTERGNYACYELVSETNIYDSTAERILPIEDPNPTECDDGWIVTVKGPLLGTRWGQGCTYNESSPILNCTNTCNQRAWTGCVATTMAQIVRYWQPANSFNYNYSSMPQSSGNSEVQRLMSDAGIWVYMDYGCSASGASGFQVPTALKGGTLAPYPPKPGFGFTSANRSSYGASGYLTVKSNLNNNWPVILEGCATRTNRFLGIIYTYSNCHMWICDGYWQSQNYCYSYLRFHMNWVWGEIWTTNNYNGWYSFNNWNPGNRNYQYAKSYIYNIHP